MDPHPRRARSAPALLVVLSLIPAAAAASPEAQFAVEGLDPQRGAFTGTVCLDVERTQVEVALRLMIGGEEVERHGTLTRVEGRAVGALTDARQGLVQGLERRPGESHLERLQVTFDAFGKRVDGTLTRGGVTLTFWGTRTGAPPEGAAYEALPAVAKQGLLWGATAAIPYYRLPRLGRAGVGKTLRDTLGALNLKGLRKTFDMGADERTPRTKIFHPYGAVAKVVFEPVAGHGFTGLFAHRTPGLVRLSLAVDDEEYVPGIGLKLFVDGQPSRNVHAIPSFDGQASRDFFARAPSTVIPEPSNLAIKMFARLARRIADPLRRSVDHVAAVSPSGAAVTSPRAPYQLVFQPASVHFAPDTRADFRTELARRVPAGSVIYTVHAKDPATGQLIRLGQLRTESGFVASAHGDRMLHFLHAR